MATLTAVKKDGEIWLKPNLPSYEPKGDPDDDDIYDAVARFRHNDMGHIALFEIEEGAVIDENDIKLTKQWRSSDLKWHTIAHESELQMLVKNRYPIRKAYIKAPRFYSETQLRSIVDEVLNRVGNQVSVMLVGGSAKKKELVKEFVLKTPCDDLL